MGGLCKHGWAAHRRQAHLAVHVVFLFWSRVLEPYPPTHPPTQSPRTNPLPPPPPPQATTTRKRRELSARSVYTLPVVPVAGQDVDIFYNPGESGRARVDFCFSWVAQRSACRLGWQAGAACRPAWQQLCAALDRGSSSPQPRVLLARCPPPPRPASTCAASARRARRR